MIKIAINGFGRIGRPTLRIILDEHPNLGVAAINDLTDTKTLAHLLQYDSIYGVYKKKVKPGDGFLSVGGKEIKVFAEKDPQNLPWKEMGIDVVLECTGRFTDFEGAQKHIKAGTKRVIISAPSKTEPRFYGAKVKMRTKFSSPFKIPSYILGVNEEKFNPQKDAIVDMGSCTTNCLAVVAKVLNNNFRILKGFITTAHSYTNDQRILDLPHEDLRRARAAAINIIPTSTGAAKAIGRVMPELQGKLDGIALRVPTPIVSILDLICQVEKKTTVEEVNNAFKKASIERGLKGILGIEDAPLVSSDYIGNSFSAIVDANLTMVQDNLVKVVAWYDNEWGYASRLAEFAEYIGRKP